MKVKGEEKMSKFETVTRMMAENRLPKYMYYEFMAIYTMTCPQLDHIQKMIDVVREERKKKHEKAIQN